MSASQELGLRWGQVDGTASVGAMSQPPATDSARPPVVVVGQVARDLVLVVDEVPGPGGTVDVEQRRELLGGKEANIAVGLTQLGVPVAVLGVVDDLVGEELLAQCRRDHLDTTTVQRPPAMDAATVEAWSSRLGANR